MKDVRRRLEHVDIPGEHDARVRAWTLVAAAFAEREPARQPPRMLWPGVALAAAVTVVAGALSPPGRAVLDSVREAVGVERAAPALVRLPAAGRLLVVGGSGDTWIVHPDGSKRRLGNYQTATWSPGGRFVAATRTHDLVALDPKGEVRWTLSREPGVAWPRWAPSGFRIAYKAGTTLRVVAGDGTGDRAIARGVRFDVPAAAWAPSRSAHLLAYADRAGRIHYVDADSGRERWRSRPGDVVQQLAWARDGSVVAALGSTSIRIFRSDGRLVTSLPHPGGQSAIAFSPRSDSLLAVARRAGRSESEVLLVTVRRPLRPPRRLFAGTGVFEELEWSPDGSHLLATWPSADQWVFLRPDSPRIAAVANVTRQYGPQGGVFPVVAGWCCP